MMKTGEFRGFFPETLRFYEELRENNDKHWFESHRNDYDKFVIEPAKAFITSMGNRLRELSPDINAIPKVDGSIFRIYRDVRFSPDKSPFKTHLGIYFWEGNRKKMECSGYYLQIEPSTIWYGGGMYQIPDDMLSFYRDNAVDEKYGLELTKAVRKVTENGYVIGGSHYKRTPRGYNASHMNAGFLLHKGLWAGVEEKVTTQFFTSEFVEYCFKRFKESAPLHKWLVGLLERENERRIEQ
jgi:uncharacterized protein (TIGR02453 family)